MAGRSFPCTFALVALVLCLSAYVEGYSSGAGSSACATGVPGSNSAGSVTRSHGSQQSGSDGHSIAFSPPLNGGAYKPSQTYTVTVSGGGNFIGFMARVSGGSVTATQSGTKTTCSGAGLTHTGTSSKSTVEFTWVAPASGEGTLDVRMTLLNSASQFYIFTETMTEGATVTCTSAPDCAALNRDLCESGSLDDTCGACEDGFYETNGDAVAKNTDTCAACHPACATCVDDTAACVTCADGYEKLIGASVCTEATPKDFSRGSVMQPSCASNCRAEAQWGRENSDMNFKLTLRDADSDWIAIGFGASRSMIDMDVIVCIFNADGSASVADYFSAARSLPSIDSDQSGLGRVGATQNGTVRVCEFSRLLAPTNTGDWSFELDADQPYIMVAYGPATDGDIEQHAALGSTHTPFISASVVDPLSTAAVEAADASNANIYTVVHAVCMTLAWVGLSPMATMIAHFLKPIGARWFQLHRGFQVFAVVLTIIGFVMVQIDGEKSLQTATPHAPLGITVLAIALIQVLLGAFRNQISNHDPKKAVDPDDHGPRRWLFNALHWTFGVGLLILSLATCAFGLILIGTETATQYLLYAAIGFDVILAIVGHLCLPKATSERLTARFVISSLLLSVAFAAAITIVVMIATLPIQSS
eukprot:m.49205 g.49205  ORF g.49205 m.49205 type:complete len:646 (-) comp11080_c0_seq1:2351-4288(-)